MKVVKKLTEDQMAKLYHTSLSNLHQTYKSPRPVKDQILSDEEINTKKQQYNILRLGATCVEYDIDETILLSVINFIKNIKNM